MLRTFVVVIAATGLISTGASPRSVRTGSNNIVVKSSVPSNLGAPAGGASSSLRHQTPGTSAKAKPTGRPTRAKKNRF